MLAVALLIAVQPFSPRAEAIGPCSAKISQYFDATECKDEVRKLVDDDLAFFLKGGGSMLGSVFKRLGDEGKLPAVLERLRRMDKFTSSDGYKAAKWGMTGAQIRKLFPKAKAEAEWLQVADPVLDKQALTGFGLSNDRLTRVMIVFSDRYMNANNYLTDFESVRALLTTKYGEPTENKANWSQDLYQDSPADWGTAVALGHVSFFAVWDLPKTRIQLTCRGERAQVALTIMYDSKELASLREQVDTNKAMSDL